ncbi:hypothetical protein ABEB36_000939 [Hypothenemus hampei]|uniref:Scavenger receptor class B member 1 n=1 Tax=Hypothenemus hampei TaxID=57062 RepID=A0ABD1FD01_HYPHA
MVCTSSLMFVHNPTHAFIRMVLSLSDGTMFFNIWSNPPYDIFLKIYIFNITNSKEFLAGEEKMNVTELGPYVYREILTNQNATFNDTEGTVTYSPHREFVFAPEHSVGNPEQHRIMTTNLPLVGLQAFLNDRDYVSNLVFSSAAVALNSQPILDVTIHDYLWGYKDSLVEMANKLLPHWIDFESFGIFARLMSRDNGNTVTIVKDPSKFSSQHTALLNEEEKSAEFHVVRWNNLTGLKDWGYEKLLPEEVKKCHLVEGVFDGTIFPKNLPANRTLRLFRKAFCRPITLSFVRDTVGKEGFRQYEYKLDDNMFDVTAENDCFCYKNKCVKGIQNIAPCYYDIPITLSQPHFYNADPKMLEQVNGLNPIKEKHGSLCAIQPELGIPLSGNMRIQVNLQVDETKVNARTRRFHGMQVPLFWIEITTADLPKIVVFLLYLLCNILPVVLEIVKYLLGLGGLALISGSALYTLFKVRLPTTASVSNSEYTSIPIISIPAEFLEKRFSLK